MGEHDHNVDAGERAKFDALGAHWWDPGAECQPLHAINPLRLDYIERRVGLSGQRVVDVGCGGGLLAEGMAFRGARVTGIDIATAALEAARLHAIEMGLDIEYYDTTPEAFAETHAGGFDVVTCLEMLEHVPDPASVVRACAHLVRPGGHVILSTLNRNPKAYLFAIVGAEYVLGLLPRGTHDYAKFIRPSELDGWARAAGLRTVDLTGLHYNPLTRQYRLGDNIDVNYLAHCVLEA